MSTVPFLQVVHQGCGIDIHKDVVVAAISGEGLKTETRSYKTFSSSLTELKNGYYLMVSLMLLWRSISKEVDIPNVS